MTTHQVPLKLNGFTIVAAIHTVSFNGLPSDSEVMILGYDPTRRHGKFVTGPIATMGKNPPREWYGGNYFEDRDAAYRDLLRRSGLNLVVCPHKAAPDQNCSERGCANYYDFTAVNV